MSLKIDNAANGEPDLSNHFDATNPQNKEKPHHSPLDMTGVTNIAELKQFAADHHIPPLAYIKLLESWALALEVDKHAAHKRIEELGGELAVISDKLAAEKETSAAAETAKKIDALTGLPNRGAFDESLLEILTQKENKPICAVFVDLDGLKQFNDYYSHVNGDRLLLAVTKHFQQRLRANDAIFRVGGDEFVLLIEGEAETIEKRMLKMQLELEKMSIRADVGMEWKDVPLWGFSFGIHSIDKNQSAEVNYQAADKEMYKNKEFRRVSQAELRAERIKTMVADRETIRIYEEWYQETVTNAAVANDRHPAPAPTSPF